LIENNFFKQQVSNSVLSNSRPASAG